MSGDGAAELSLEIQILMMPRATLQEMHQEDIRSIFDKVGATLH